MLIGSYFSVFWIISVYNRYDRDLIKKEKKKRVEMIDNILLLLISFTQYR